jgi:hypothetical protein
VYEWLVERSWNSSFVSFETADQFRIVGMKGNELSAHSSLQFTDLKQNEEPV